MAQRDPSLQLGQGVKGGLGALPGGSSLRSGGGQLGAGLSSGGVHVQPGGLSPGLQSGAAPPRGGGLPTSVMLQSQPRSSLPYPGMDDGDLIDAIGILDKVKHKKIQMGTARQMLAGLSSSQRDRLAQHVLIKHSSEGGSPNDELAVLMPLPQAKRLEEQIVGKTKQSLFDRLETAVGDTVGPPINALGGDIRDFTTGLFPGLGLAGVAIGKQAYQMGRHPMRDNLSHGPVAEDIVKPAAKQVAWQYGPLVKGKPGEFAHRFGQHPLGPLLDAAALASAGIGTVGRVGEATRAVELGKVTDLASGGAKVGKFTVEKSPNGTWEVFDHTGGPSGMVTHPSTNLPYWAQLKIGPKVAQGFADKTSAVHHAQSLVTGGIHGSDFARAMKGATRGGPKGGLIDFYDKHAGVTHEKETGMIAKEIAEALDPNTPLAKGIMSKSTWGQVVRDIKATRQAGKEKPTEMHKNLPGFFPEPGAGIQLGSRALGTAGTALREASDLVRAGAVYLRGAYLPNNWAGNAFMNAVHQGVFAPINLAKSLAMEKYGGFTPREIQAMDRSMGMNPAEAIMSGKGRGYIASATSPVAHTMGMIADQPFRRAAFYHEARRAGYRTQAQVKGLIQKAQTSEEAQMHMAEIARRAQEEIGKFGRMNQTERQVLRNLVFVYSWMRAAGRYSYRFPMQHPIQAAVDDVVAKHGNQYVDEQMGGVPSFLVGSVPVGHNKDGDPILINPFNLNPLGTGLQLGQVAAGTGEVLTGSKSWNRFSKQDVLAIANPLIQSYMEGREGGKSPIEQNKQAIAIARLVHDLQHPGSGGIFPTSRTEAIGHFMGGGLFPREAEQAAITRSLEREQRNNRAALIPEQRKMFKKYTGEDIPDQIVGAYKADLEMVDELKNFTDDYARHHGTQGFRNMPAENKLAASIAFMEKYGHLSKQEIAELRIDASEATTDAEMSEMANSIFAMTGIGTMKRQWDDLMAEARGQQKTRMAK